MDTDQLSKFTINEETKKLMRRNVVLVSIILAFSIIYFIIDWLYWYNALSLPINKVAIKEHYFFYHRLVPVFAIFKMSASILYCIIEYKAYKFQLIGIDKHDEEYFKKGVGYFNITLAISILFFLLSFFEIAYRDLYMN
ncbi:MAG TPA: hypothetical protein VK718_11755 [Ferruginibacter sp.]|jgi:hypothetical protein|nr:hypothetical protein [Ferruginibacter sp.]